MCCSSALFLCLCVEGTMTSRLFSSTRQSRTHELVTTITNVTRNIELAQCSLQVEQSHLFSSRHILKRHAPRVWLWAWEGGEEESMPGRNVTLSCDVDAHPKPNMTWRGDHSEILRAGGNLNFTSIKQRPGYYRMEMTITNVTEEQFMTYTCHAENELGADSKQIVLKKTAEYVAILQARSFPVLPQYEHQRALPSRVRRTRGGPGAGQL
ncbi:uncharacterized protein LOC122374787 [Amphibalanus amphitrite]|uniref:uncharacterized protein LOC122374787 n=1 Tax=Amphibalanus amphitrite TaxID=1232801 RepID=UPI001C9165CE|nr:uncharacterized protein LOC122374787 [Amphibalanus amphitrite]